jgi:phenylacetate-CoA ligase
MNAALRQQLFFKLQRLVGSDAESAYNEFLAVERMDSSRYQELTHDRLTSVLRHAVNNVPYYRDRAQVRNEIDLGHFPVVTKSELRDHFPDFLTSDIAAQHAGGAKTGSGYSWTEVQTGGTTGIPTTVIHDREFRDRGRASRMYSQYLCGFPFGVPYFRLWGSMADINNVRDSIQQRVMKRLSREILLNAFRMEDSDVNRYIELVNSSEIHHMIAYVDAAAQVARHAEANGMRVRPLRSLMACAGTVTSENRSLLERAFHCRVHNKYGSRDCADMACECDQGGLHIFENNVHIEVVDDLGRDAGPGERGRILVTLLGNYAFPLIRYEIGDVGVLAPGLCDCGRPMPLLDGIEGRTVEFLLSGDRGYISPVYIRHLIGVVHNPGFIRRFQLIQESPSLCELKFETEKGVDDDRLQDCLSHIQRDLGAVFGQSARITMTRVTRLEETESGKFLYTRNKMMS